MKNVVIFALAAVIAATCLAAEIADPNAIPRTVGTHVGVQGGIPTTRTNIINVTSAPFYASGNASVTTGNVMSGNNSLVVASAAGWSTGMGITAGHRAVITMTVTSAADGDGGTFHVKLPMNDPALQVGHTLYSDYGFTLTAGQTASSIAAQVRAYTGFRGWDVTGGTGADVEFTAKRHGVRPIGETWSGFTNNSANVTSSWAITSAGVTGVNTTVFGVSGNTITLTANATATLSGGQVLHRDDLAIQAAIAASSPQDIIYMPAGSYRVDATITVGSYSNRTLRGAGMAATTLIADYATTGISSYNDSDYAWSRQTYALPAASADNLVTDGMTKGSETITIGDTSAFSVGQSIQLAVDNQYSAAQLEAGALFTHSVFGYNTSWRPMHRIVSKTSTTLTITPPIYMTPASNLQVHVNRQATVSTGIGLEDFHLDGTHGIMGLGYQVWQAQNSWMRGVKITMLRSPGQVVSINNSIFMEIRRCDFRGPNVNGSSGAGILTDQMNASLIEDNIIVGVNPAIELNASTVGNITGLNYLMNSPSQPLWVNHAPHNSHNLHEANVVGAVQSDSYFGSASHDTFFRNWITGRDFENSTYLGHLFINQWSRNYSVIGNIVGTSADPYLVSPYDPWEFGSPWGGAPSGSPVRPSAGVHYPQWNNIAELTTRTSDTAGELTITSGSGVIDFNSYPMALQPLAAPHTSGTITATAQTGSVISFTGYTGTLPSVGAEFRLYFGLQNYGMNQKDQDALPHWWPSTPGTTYTIGNYNAHLTVAAIPAEQALGGDTLPDSLYTSKADLEARGVVLGNLAYPPFDPTSPGSLTSADIARIPAGYRYLNNGADPPSGAPSFNPRRLRILFR